jgi:hypothetical protein
VSYEEVLKFDRSTDLIHYRARRHVGIETVRDFQTYVDRSILAGVGVNLAEGWVLEPDPNAPNRLGARYRPYQAAVHDSQIEVPDWYNR